jgi:hypothetical protein
MTRGAMEADGRDLPKLLYEFLWKQRLTGTIQPKRGLHFDKDLAGLS